MDYSFDTSALVEPWRRLYPPDMFARVWKHVDGLMITGVAGASCEVLHELERIEDGLFDWAQQRRNVFLELEEDVMVAVKDVLRVFANMSSVNTTRSNADPFVVALALVNKCGVVTYETIGKNGQPKIPNVCKHFGIRCEPLMPVLRNTGFNAVPH